MGKKLVHNLEMENSETFIQLKDDLRTIKGAILPPLHNLSITEHWYIGQTLHSSGFYQQYKADKYAVTLIAKHRNVCKSTVYKELQFYRKFKEVEEGPGVLNIDTLQNLLPQGVFVSWRSICKYLLPDTVKEKEVEIVEEKPKQVHKKIEKQDIRRFFEMTEGSKYLQILNENEEILTTVEVKV